MGTKDEESSEKIGIDAIDCTKRKRKLANEENMTQFMYEKKWLTSCSIT